jgi:hypothetical protein
VHIDGVKDNQPTSGLGFVELSGYSGRPAFWWLFRSAWEDDGSL